eukprot:gene22065-30299_t
MLSLSDLTQLYQRRKSPPKLLCDLSNAELPLKGSDTIDRLNKLFNSRLYGSHPAFSRPVDTTKNAKKGIALCFVIVDELFHESIWRTWSDSRSSGSYFAKVFIHAKNPSKILSEWTRQRTLDVTFKPEWNSPEVVRAMLAVLQAALNDKDTTFDRFIFLTESCVPIYDLQDLGDRLFQDDCSWMDAFHIPQSKWEKAACFDSVDSRIIPPEAVWKAVPGWIALNRKHAMEIVALSLDGARLGLQDLVLAWGPGGQYSEEKGGVFAPEEVYFPTMLALLGYLRKGASSEGAQKGEVKLRSVNYAEFVRRGDPNPKTFSYISSKLVAAFRRTGALFARKFGKGSITTQQWHHAVLSSVVPSEERPKTGNDVNSNQVTVNYPNRGDSRKRSYSSLLDNDDNGGSIQYSDTGKKKSSDEGTEK